MIHFLLQVTACSHQQFTRLIHQYLKADVIKQHRPHKPSGFKQKYTVIDIALLVKMDERYDTPSGAVIKKLCERAKYRYDKMMTPYEKLKPLEPK